MQIRRRRTAGDASAIANEGTSVPLAPTDRLGLAGQGLQQSYRRDLARRGRSLFARGLSLLSRARAARSDKRPARIEIPTLLRAPGGAIIFALARVPFAKIYHLSALCVLRFHGFRFRRFICRESKDLRRLFE